MEIKTRLDARGFDFDLEIDGETFRIDKGDVWNLYTIMNSVFDEMPDPVRTSDTVKG